MGRAHNAPRIFVAHGRVRGDLRPCMMMSFRGFPSWLRQARDGSAHANKYNDPSVRPSPVFLLFTLLDRHSTDSAASRLPHRARHHEREEAEGWLEDTPGHLQRHHPQHLSSDCCSLSQFFWCRGLGSPPPTRCASSSCTTPSAASRCDSSRGEEASTPSTRATRCPRPARSARSLMYSIATSRARSPPPRCWPSSRGKAARTTA